MDQLRDTYAAVGMNGIQHPNGFTYGVGKSLAPNDPNGPLEMNGLYTEEIEELLSLYEASHLLQDSGTTRFLVEWEMALFLKHMSLNAFVLYEQVGQRRQLLARPSVIQYTPDSVGYVILLNTPSEGGTGREGRNNHWEVVAKRYGTQTCIIFTIEEGERYLELLTKNYDTAHSRQGDDWSAYKNRHYDPCNVLNVVTVLNTGERHLNYKNYFKEEFVEVGTGAKRESSSRKRGSKKRSKRESSSRKRGSKKR